LSWTCRYCGKDTSDIDYDYLDGYDHLSCALENNNKMKITNLKISNPEKINTKNLCLDKSTIDINYMGHKAKVKDYGNVACTFYEFIATKDYNSQSTIFQIEDEIKNNKVEVTILKSGKMTIDEFSIELIKDRSKLINKMIEWVNEKVS
jgi:hypothetical protein